MYAYSKYETTPTGNGTATVAKWSFKVNGQTQKIPDIDLAQTMDTHNNVEKNKIASGTQGHFDLELDGRESEVAIDYDIKLAINEKPTNLKFYVDSEYKYEIPVNDSIMNVKGSIALENLNIPLIKTIYWKWPYQTGTLANEIKENDKIDTNDSTKNVKIAITVTGTQIDTKGNEPIALADVVNIGDYVNYDATSGNGGGKSYTTDSNLTGSDTTTTFNSNEIVKWKVLNIDKTSGTVELMAENTTDTTLTLNGIKGYINAIKVLDEIGNIYGQGNGAIGGRSITVEDINKLENYRPNGDRTTKTYTSGTFINEDGTLIVASNVNPVTIKYTDDTINKSTNDYYFYYTKNFIEKTFFVASRCIWLRNDDVFYYVRTVTSGHLAYNFWTFKSGGTEKNVLPVVILRSNIKTNGRDSSGAWNLDI